MSNPKLAAYLRSLKMTTDLWKFRLDFEKRLEFQKTIYLLQEAGADLGYRFGWYIHGPYSSSLADDSYSLASMPREFFDKIQDPLDENVRQKLQTLLDSLPRAKDRAHWLELLACVHFVMEYSYPKINSKKQAIDYLLRLKGKKFSETEMDKAFDLLQKNGFLK